MPYLGPKSSRMVDTLDGRLRQFLIIAIVDGPDFSVIEGYRGEAVQESYFDKGLTQLHYPDSLHNVMDDNEKPASLAVHLLPYPSDASIWKDRERLTFFAGWVLGRARAYFNEHDSDTIVGLRWGGDWDGDGFVHDNNFDDLTHFELVVKEGS